MEKSKLHHHLSTVKAFVAQGKVRITQVAMRGAVDLGMRIQDILDMVSALENDDFYKSMTAYDDHTCWQDVYHPETMTSTIYLKLTVYDDVLIISFKEK